VGLDMYAVAVDPAVWDDATQTLRKDATQDQVERLAYWRKHHDLHGWMERLYRQRGGTKDFNCVQLPLDSADLNALEQAVIQRKLPATVGFFFGNNPPDAESDAEDLAFIAKARDAIAAGKVVLYDSWW